MRRAEIQIEQTPVDISSEQIWQSIGPLVCFRAGDKRLELRLIRPIHVFNSEIITEPGSRIPGVTTALYRRSREVMEEVATELGYPLDYYFDSKNPSMVAWAQAKNKGVDVFDWDYLDISDEGVLIARKIIYPLGV